MILFPGSHLAERAIQEGGILREFPGNTLNGRKPIPGLSRGGPRKGKQDHVCVMRNSPAENVESLGCLQKLHQRRRTCEDSVRAFEARGAKIATRALGAELLPMEGGMWVDSLRCELWGQSPSLLSPRRLGQGGRSILVTGNPLRETLRPAVCLPLPTLHKNTCTVHLVWLR